MAFIPNVAASIIGAVDSVTPGRLGQTLNTNLRRDDVNWQGAANSNHLLMNGITSDQYAASQSGGNTDTDQSGQYTGGTGSGTTSAQRAASQLQIDQINRLLGSLDTQQTSGLGRLTSSFNDQNARLGEQKTKTMAGYDEQKIENDQDKQRGVDQVSQFANSSYNNLQRILQGANAGNSSVGRQLMPHFVSKAAGTRRQGVFDTAGKNEQNITSARGQAEDEYGYAAQDLDNQRKGQEEQFLQGIGNQRNDLLSKRLAMESDAGMATSGTQAELDSRTAELDSLFGRFSPTYTQRAMNLSKPELGKYTLDPAQIRLDQNTPQESRYFSPLIKKKQQLDQGV